MKKYINKTFNICVRSFPWAKIKCMKDYRKFCIPEKNPDYIIFHVGTNDPNSELPLERIAKPIIDVAKETLNQTVK